MGRTGWLKGREGSMAGDGEYRISGGWASLSALGLGIISGSLAVGGLLGTEGGRIGGKSVCESRFKGREFCIGLLTKKGGGGIMELIVCCGRV